MKESSCKPYLTRYQPTGSCSSPAPYGLQEFCSLSPISVARKFNGSCNSWLLSPFDDERPVALLVGDVRLSPARISPICKNSFRGQRPSPSKLDNVRPFHRGHGCVRRSFFDCVGARIASEGCLGGSLVPHSRGHINSSTSPIAARLAFPSNSHFPAGENA